MASQLPNDWSEGWDNVAFAVSCEDQKRVEERIPCLLNLSCKHRWISLKPFIGEVDLDPYLSTGKIEWFLAGGENYLGKRPLDFEWVKKVRDSCLKYHVRFTFAQTGNVFIKDGKKYSILDRTEQMIQALKSNMNVPSSDIEKEVLDILSDKSKKKEMIQEAMRRRTRQDSL